ncbi:ATP-binding protein [Aquimarina agarivorans]|uniref:ATP-binding protein n=1 Tax=Aquimarina agarivorans TaxID=980584 RepID=UPI000248FCD0|nr:ATP-binding protein [Aquimarina agarivorans]
MKYKDIVNNSISNLENCEDEPIHIPGLIQPHGFLISVDSELHIITLCSENTQEFINLSYEELLGKSIDDILDQDLVEQILNREKSTSEAVTVFEHSISGVHFAISVHSSANTIIIEGEPTDIQFNKEHELYNSSKQLLSYIKDSSTLKELCNEVASAIKNITKYDRVMVYRFDDDYNGEVYAESKEEHLEPYLGLHYPHTDIPPQARALYIKNLLRIIGDVHYKPVKLYTYQQSAIAQLDLSMSILRSVSPIHIQYLQNMGVGATMTLSLVHKGKLWGLIACHHYSPKYLSESIKNTVKLHGHFITSQIDVRILNEQYKIAENVNIYVDRLISKDLNYDRNSINQLFNETSCLNLCNSDGISAVINGEVYTSGITPDRGDIKVLGSFLLDYSKNTKFETSNLSRVTSDFKLISQEFPGINYNSLGDENNFLIWYRLPTTTSINWAGDPKKAINKNANGLSPRTSFATFIENVKDTSMPWLQSELEASSKFYYFLQNHIRSIIINEEKEKQRQLSEVLKETNAELENINWISTHDLQEPLRKIRMMASTLLLKKDVVSLADDTVKRIERMQSSAERMQILINDILKYTKTTSGDAEFEDIDVTILLGGVKNDLKETLSDANATLTIEKLPQINGVSFLLKQLFLNTIYNSLKFKKPDVNPEIVISSDTKKDELNPQNAYHLIKIKDNGIGFKNDYNAKIFKIFARLNNKEDYKGSGIGLALCKKIMIKHHGLISAEGEPNKGATIKLYFPKV